ncbi:MAG: insulinase family protein [Actinobacteria bacterium]|nr:MAG: insulinase family protein [Actinomycetota bacterium]
MQRLNRRVSALGRAPLAPQDEAAHPVVDRCEVPVQELLGLVGFRRDMRALAQLEHRLERRRPVAAGADHEPALMLRDWERILGEPHLDSVREGRDVLPEESPAGRHRADVARCMAVALLDGRRRDHHVIADARDRGVRLPRDRPRLAREPAHGLERQRRLALVADRDEGVGGRGVAEHDVESVCRRPGRERGVERRAAAGEEDASGLREPGVDPQRTQPRRLRGDGGGCQTAGHGGSIPCARVAVFERRELSNGIRVVTAPMPRAQSTSCVIMFAAGSRYETAENNGIAHFAEHMFFKGTERRPTARQIAGEIDGIGGEFNAFTSKEYTGYYVRCAAEHRDVSFDVLVDMLRHSRFVPEEIEREKGVIVEEMRMRVDTPRDHVSTVYDELLYGDQPLGWEILGREETVRAVSRDTFLSYLDTWYRPERMVVGVGGRLGDGLIELLEELLGDIEPRDTGAAPPVEIPQNGSTIALHTKDSDQAHLILGARSYPLGHPDRYALQMLTVILGGGMSSRLFTEVRERRGLAYYVYAAAQAYTDAGTLAAQAGVDLNRIDDAIATIVAELRKIATETVPEDELVKAKSFAKGRFALQLESPHGTVMFGMRREVLEGAAEEPEAVIEGINAVTLDDVARVAQDVIGGRLYLALVGPFDDPGRFEKIITTS